MCILSLPATVPLSQEQVRLQLFRCGNIKFASAHAPVQKAVFTQATKKAEQLKLPLRA
jgi:hypothetical protein